MSRNIVEQQPFSPVEVGSSGLAYFGRPGLLLSWTLAALPAASLAVVGLRIVRVSDDPLAFFILPLAGIVMGATLMMLSTAAYRAVLRPDAGDRAFLRLGSAEWRVFWHGQHYNG
ncbi:MAG: hypothetical protein JWR84_2673 [Caulobacter sp.]|nr:hypothetical protein [Caulobacter sp.]